MNPSRPLLALLLAATGASLALAKPPRPPRPVPKPAAKVDTPAEKRADRNHNGWVDPAEARRVAPRQAYLRNRSDVDRPWEKAADRNQDGVVDAVELRSYHLVQLDANGNGRIEPAERKTYWLRLWVVDSPLERKFDLDGNGFLDWTEARRMLREKYRHLASSGQARVDTDLELEFDTNANGFIDPAEIPALQAALDADE